jgi:membrane protease subunit HflC
LLLQFGRIEGADAKDTSDYKPGLHFKMPIVQQVVRYDRRILNLDAQPERYFTSEKKAVNVDFYVKWKIENGAAYYRSFGADEFQLLANQRLGSIIKNSLRFEFNSRPLNELIASARSDITEKVIEQGNKGTEETLGIKIVDVRIKRIEFPDEVVNSVYDRMRAERTRLANEQRSNGREAAAKITADADRQVQVLKAEAERDAQQARGEGDAKGRGDLRRGLFEESGVLCVLPQPGRLSRCVQERRRHGARSEVRVPALFRRAGSEGEIAASSGILAGRQGLLL